MQEDAPVVRPKQQLIGQAAARGRYAPLYRHLAAMAGSEWWVSFSEIEVILGFELPAAARLHRSWWTNQGCGGGHSHALAWQATGWKTTRVDLEAETLVFEREGGPLVRAGQVNRPGIFDLDRDFPAVIDTGRWPEGFAVRREEIYDDAGRLVGGPEEETGRGR